MFRENRKKNPEYREQKNFSLTILVQRHGPKDGTAGPLSSEGEEIAAEYFRKAYEGVLLDSKSGGVDIESSPIDRAKRTGELHAAALRAGSGKIKSIQEDERLSEGLIAHHPELIERYGGQGGKWFIGWLAAKKRSHPEVKTGQEAAADFAQWLLEKIRLRKTEGGSQEIDAFTHGPLMAAFLLTLQKKRRERIIPEDRKIQKILSYLAYFNVHIDSQQPETVHLSFQGRTFSFPLNILVAMTKK